MKKIFTLFAVAAMAITASAQGTYQYDFEEAVAAGTTVQAVPNCTLTFGAAGDADFKAAKKSSEIEGYTHFCEGNGGNPKVTDGIIVSGTAYELKPALDGKITVAVVLNANKSFYVLQDGTALPAYDGLRVDEKAYTTYSFDVTGGKTYIVYCAGSKLGLFGFTYEVTGGDTPEPVEGELSISPVAINPSWGTTFDAYKGSITCDGKVMEVSNFPFSGAKFSLDLVIRDGQQGSTRPIYKLIPQTGFTEKGEVNNYGVIEKLYAIDNQPEELVMTLDGVNSVKFVEYTFMFGSSTSAQFIPSETGAPYYDTVILYLVGKYQQFADGAWGEVKNNGYINFKVDVPVTGGTSNIDEVAVDFDENAPVEYYNLQGVRVAEPSNGVFIKRQGNKVVKVLVK